MKKNRAQKMVMEEAKKIEKSKFCRFLLFTSYDLYVFMTNLIKIYMLNYKKAFLNF